VKGVHETKGASRKKSNLGSKSQKLKAVPRVEERRKKIKPVGNCQGSERQRNWNLVERDA